MDITAKFLLEIEPDYYLKATGADPYAITVTRLNCLDVEHVPARFLAYVNEDYSKADVIYLDGTRGIVFKQQIMARK
jgi:hypothetical protein